MLKTQQTLRVEDFVGEPRVVQRIDSLTRNLGTRQFSDISDQQGNQYIDLVMEGGGVLGIALVGYCYALEQAGIRFRSVAGTSAGAITALFLQVVAPPGEAKSWALIQEIANMPMASFQDGGDDARSLIRSFLNGGSPLNKLLALVRNKSELSQRLGINPGDVFTSWVRKRLAHYDIHSLADLQAILATPPAGGLHDASEPEVEYVWRARLAVVATELTTGRKVVLPRNADLFYTHPEKASPAEFVRASMSVPYFFEPHQIDPLPSSGSVDAAWDSFLEPTLPKGSIALTPRSAMFVDGGLLSNFPIAEFHRRDGKPPKMPTFGVKLGYDSSKVAPPRKLRGFSYRLIDAMRYDADVEFLQNNPEYRLLIGRITTEGYHWLDFEMSREDQVGLFYQGVTAAAKFLEDFDWERYKQCRATML